MLSRWRNDGILIVSVAASLLAASLAIYSRDTMGWQAGEFYVHMNHYVMGVPKWLALNQFDLDPESSTLNVRLLPDAEKYPPGWHVHPVPLAVSTLACLVLSMTMVVVMRALPVRSCDEASYRFLWGYAIGCLPALAVGAVVPTEPEWIGVTLGLGVLPVCVMIAAAVMRDYVRGVCLAFMVAIAIWWSQRIVDMFRSKHGIGSLPNAEDLAAIAIFGGVYALASLISTFVARLLHNMVRVAEQADEREPE